VRVALAACPTETSNYGLNTEKHNMMTTTKFSILAEPAQSDQPLAERPRVADRRRPVTRPKVETEPETRLWKICAKAVSRRLSGVEWVALLLLGASALGALAYGFSESFHLINSDALDQTVRPLLTR
jgi:hypothetical protein